MAVTRNVVVVLDVLSRAGPGLSTEERAAGLCWRITSGVGGEEGVNSRVSQCCRLGCCPTSQVFWLQVSETQFKVAEVKQTNNQSNKRT